VILAIADQDVAVRHDGHALESFELRVAGAPGAEGLQEAAVRIEDLNAVVARIGHEYVALIVHGHTAGKKQIPRVNTLSIKTSHSICSPWKLELAVVGTLAAHCGQDLAVHVENLRMRKR